MRVWHISDTHGLHEQLSPPSEIDIVIHSGDASNSHSPALNEHELHRFLAWFSALPVKHKIFVPGNHDTSLERGLIRKVDIIAMGIVPLIDSEITIGERTIWGSPWTPRYGDWAWMTKRETINRKWEQIPNSIDVLVTHGPPFGILDATYARNGNTEMVGCRALQKRVFALKPQWHLFGHVHGTDDIRNTGTRNLAGLRTQFSNGTCCDDGLMHSVTSNGNVFELA